MVNCVTDVEMALPKLALFLKKQLTSRFGAKTLGFSLFATGSYVMYEDYVRYPRMISIYKTGNYLPPTSVADLPHVPYFKRPELESELSVLMSSTCTGEYYLINGEPGSGKTRTVLQVVDGLMKSSGMKNDGAPVYVTATQGQSFSDSLAQAVNFHFNEHLQFKLFMDFVLGVRGFPSQQEHHKLQRVLCAIEDSAFLYHQSTGCPVVVVIDGVNTLEKQMPGTMLKLQYKAKLWADTNIAKVIFITNDENTEEQFRSNSSCWTRLGAPFHVHDISKEDTMNFLSSNNASHDGCIPSAMADQIYNLVGGRVRYLTLFKKDLEHGIPFSKIAQRMREKEQEKFINVVENPTLWKIVEMIKFSPTRSLTLGKITSKASRTDVIKLAEMNIIKLERHHDVIMVTFESKLTENVVDHIRSKWEVSV